MLDGKHALRPAETAESRVRHGVGLEPLRAHMHRRQEIGIVGMKHRAVDDPAREIRRVAAAGEMLHAVAGDPALLIEPDLKVAAKIVPLAGEHEIVVPVEPQLEPPPQQPSVGASAPIRP